MQYDSVKFLLPLALMVWISACSGDSDSGDSDDAPTMPEVTGDEPTGGTPITDELPPVDMENEPADEVPAQSARYRLTFASTWSVETHPASFPSGPHFSGLIGAVHNEQVIFWETGQIASDGIEQMAETGGKTLFRNELNAAVSDGKASNLIDAGGISLSPGTVSTEFTVTRDYPEITVVSMLAPSPDWFVGLRNHGLLDSDGQFIEQQNIDLRLYDSGTDSGESYTSSNSDTEPREPITRFSSLDNTLPFTDGLPVVGQFAIQKIE